MREYYGEVSHQDFSAFFTSNGILCLSSPAIFHILLQVSLGGKKETPRRRDGEMKVAIYAKSFKCYSRNVQAVHGYRVSSLLVLLIASSPIPTAPASLHLRLPVVS